MHYIFLIAQFNDSDIQKIAIEVSKIIEIGPGHLAYDIGKYAIAFTTLATIAWLFVKSMIKQNEESNSHSVERERRMGLRIDKLEESQVEILRNIITTSNEAILSNATSLNQLRLEVRDELKSLVEETKKNGAKLDKLDQSWERRAIELAKSLNTTVENLMKHCAAVSNFKLSNENKENKEK